VEMNAEINARSTILIVNASADQLVWLDQLLQERYHVKLARSGADALRILAQAPRPDLVLLDAALPDMDGVALLREIKSDFLAAAIPLLLVLAGAETAYVGEALAVGAADVVQQPVVAATLLARVDTQLQLSAARAMLQDQHRHFEHLIAERTRDAARMQDATIMAMAALAESRDPDIGRHLRRTQHFVAAMARQLRFKAAYTVELTNENIALLFKAAPLHDIGKVGVADAILLKPGKLTDDEFKQMTLHTVHGRDAIDGVARSVGGSSQFLRYAREITYSHQEKWDGSGYPQGLKEQAIPLSARLMAVADVYDALISERAYRPAFTHETAVELIRQGRGEHFDPDVVDAMLTVEEQFRDIAAEINGQ